MTNTHVNGQWALVYSGSTWIVCSEEQGWIGTTETIELFADETACLARVSALGLTPRFPEPEEV
jgi:hypothetical protein